MSKSIILTGGGTAGHVMPNLALIPFLKNYFDEFHYFGSEKGVEKDIIAGFSFIKYHIVPSVKFQRSLSLKNLGIPFKLSAGTRKAKKLIKQIDPDIIFSKGGYVALPAVRGAGKVPVICHESDLSIGLANKMSARKCTFVCTSFSDTAGKVKNGIHTGAPIRNEIYNGRKLDLIFEQSLPVLLIMGGSLGARAINECVRSSLTALTSNYNIIHIVGKGNAYDAGTPSRGRYYQFEFAQNIADFYATADFVVSRGGAGSLFELTALAKPSLIIPLPKGNSRGDQVQNAEYFESLGCCRVLAQDGMTGESLLKAIENLAADSMLRRKLAEVRNIDGTKKIAQLIIDTAKEYRARG